jgi:small subunit ribosomal protein S6
VNVGAPGLDVALPRVCGPVDRCLAALELGTIRLEVTRRGELRPQLLRMRRLGLRRIRSRAPPEHCAQPQGAGQHCEQALHAGDATLPPLLATPVAPFPEAAPGGGADSVHEKEEFGLLNDYEIMLLLDPELSDERGSEIIKRIRDAVEAAQGTWDGHEPWGRRRLAFEIDHKSEAVYHLLLFTAPAETLAEITRVLKITDGVMRHGAFRRVKDGHTKAPSQVPVAVPAATASASDDDTDSGSE